MDFSNTSKNDMFTISSAHQEFRNRRNNIFEQLDVAERNRKNLPKNLDEFKETATKSEEISKRISTKHFRGKESIFKKPEAPISKCLPVRNVPDFRKNPHKWTKYSLADVKDEDISERGNTAAAMSFLKELESRNCDNDDDTTMKELPTKITFKKSVIVEKNTDGGVEETKHAFRNSKVVMPEYVVGQKLKKDKKNKMKRSGNAGKQLRLDHLLDEDDES